MTRFNTYLLLALISLASIAGNKKYERTIARADAFYEHFAYAKAIKLYEEALDIQDEQSPKIQIANCYRLINQPEQAMIWYEKAMAQGPLSGEDMIQYGQILSELERYDSAYQILDRYQDTEEWIKTRSEGFKDPTKFYFNEIAYEISDAPFNSKYADFSPTYKADGSVVFVSGRPHSGWFKSTYKSDNTLFLNLFEVKDDSTAVKMERGISTRFHEGPTQFYFNDERMIFTRNNYNNHTAAVSEEGVQHLKMYLSEKLDAGRWSMPEEFPYNSDEYSVGHPALANNVQTLYFASDMPGGYGGVDLYKSVKKNGNWSEPENLGEKVNTARDEMFPFISNNGFLYFSSDGHEGLGGLDIYRVDLERPNASPRNMGFALNTYQDDFGIVFNPETNNTGYFSSNRAGGKGGDDIYKIKMYDHVVKVNLRDFETKELITGELYAFDPHQSEVVRDEKAVSSIRFPALAGDVFNIDGSATEYIPDSLTIELKEATRDLREIEFDVYLKKPGFNTIIYVVEINHESQQVLYTQDDNLNLFAGNYTTLTKKFKDEFVTIDSVVYLNNVLYDFDKHNIREDAKPALRKWVAFMNQFPKVKVSLSSHTDVRGSNNYNDRLAKRRVKEALHYLILSGIDRNRFVERSFGEDKLWESCPEKDCDEVQHQNNRRTEILVERAD